MTKAEITQAILETIKTARMNLEHAHELHQIQKASADDISQWEKDDIGAAILSCLMSAQVSMERVQGIQMMAKRIYPDYLRVSRKRVNS